MGRGKKKKSDKRKNSLINQNLEQRIAGQCVYETRSQNKNKNGQWGYRWMVTRPRSRASVQSGIDVQNHARWKGKTCREAEEVRRRLLPVITCQIPHSRP